MSTPSTPALPELLAHTRWIEDLARSLVRDPDAAQDLAQSTILIALERTEAEPANLRAWLARVLRNKARETGRRESARGVVERLGARTEALPSAEEVIERAEHERGVVAAVLALEEPHRGTLLLRYFEGLSPAEIARRSHVPLATVTSRITRAHARLRESLSKDGGSADWVAAIVPILRQTSVAHTVSASSIAGVFVMSIALKIAATLVVVALVVWWSLPNGSRDTHTTALGPTVHDTSLDATGGPDEPALAAGSKRTATTAETAAKPAVESAPVVSVTPTPAAETAVGGRIFGHVFRPDGEAAAQRKVRMIRMTLGPEKYVVTDDAGSFDERNLGPGTWSLSTWPDDKEVQLLGKTGPDTLHGMTYMAQSTVDLANGAEIELVLGKPPEHGVRVHGRMLDDGKPVDGYMTWLPQGKNAMDQQQLAPSSPTKGFDVLLNHSGRYLLVAIQDEVRAEFVVDVPNNTDFAYDIVLPSGLLEGRVVTGDGTPVVAAHVDLVPRGAHNPRQPMADIQYSLRTDDNGKFRFRCLPRARFELGVHGGKFGPKDAGQPAGATAVRDIDLTSNELSSDLVVVVPSGSIAHGVVHSVAKKVGSACVFVFTSEGEPVNPLDSITVKEGKFETFALQPGTWFAIAANGFEWSPATRFVVPVKGDPDEIELRLAPVAKLTVDTSGMGPAWIDVRDANHCSISSLLDKHVFNREFNTDWSTSSFVYRLPAGNYDVAAIGAKDRRTGYVSLTQGQELSTRLGEK